MHNNSDKTITKKKKYSTKKDNSFIISTSNDYPDEPTIIKELTSLNSTQEC